MANFPSRKKGKGKERKKDGKFSFKEKRKGKEIKLFGNEVELSFGWILLPLLQLTSSEEIFFRWIVALDMLGKLELGRWDVHWAMECLFL